MSAPQTNVEKQAKRHRLPLTGFVVVVVFALTLLLGLIIWVAMRGESPEGADVQQQTGIGTTTTEEAAE